MRRAFLHGFLGDPEVWTGIAGPDDVVLVLPGHGAPRASITIEGAEIIDASALHENWYASVAAIGEQVQKCDVAIGYSMGARVALGLLATGRVPRAILISVNPGLPEAEKAARRETDAAWARRFRTEPLPAVLDAWEAQPLFATQARVSSVLLEARRARRLMHDPEQLARSLETMGLAEMPDYRSLITEDNCELIVGADDARYVALARALAAPTLTIAESGHDPLLEQPAALAKMLASPP